MTFPNLLDADAATSSPPPDNEILSVEQLAQYEAEREAEAERIASRRTQDAAQRAEREAFAQAEREHGETVSAQLAAETETANAGEEAHAAQVMADLERAFAPAEGGS